jgi:FtsZ-interacting cell division protein ZipA
MNLLLVIAIIVGVLAVIAIFVSSHYRNRDGYKRIFANGAPERRRRFASAVPADSTYDLTPFTTETAGGQDHDRHHHYAPEPTDCGVHHGAGDTGGCSDGGSGGSH